MNIDRRQLILPPLAFGLLSVAGVSVVPALAASADEEAVAKNLEAFRVPRSVSSVQPPSCASTLSASRNLRPTARKFLRTSTS